jgi:hypothetical protein
MTEDHCIDGVAYTYKALAPKADSQTSTFTQGLPAGDKGKRG